MLRGMQIWQKKENEWKCLFIFGTTSQRKKKQKNAKHNPNPIFGITVVLIIETMIIKKRILMCFSLTYTRYY